MEVASSIVEEERRYFSMPRSIVLETKMRARSRDFQARIITIRLNFPPTFDPPPCPLSEIGIRGLDRSWRHSCLKIRRSTVMAYGIPNSGAGQQKRFGMTF